MKTIHVFMTGLALFIASGSLGCSKSFRAAVSSTGLSSSGQNTSATPNTPVDISSQIQKAQNATKDAQMAIADANAVISQITDDKGNINIGLFTKASNTVMGAVQAQGVLNDLGLTDKIKAVFDTLFAKVAVVKQQIADARQQLANALAALNQADPANAAMIQQITAQMGTIDTLESQFSTQMHSLADKLDLVSTGLEGLITGATTAIPGWGSIVGLALDVFVMSDVKALIADLKARLMAL